MPIKMKAFWIFTLFAMFHSFPYIMASQKNNLIVKLDDHIPLSFHNNSYPMTSCKLLDPSGRPLPTKLSKSRNSCTHHIQNASSSDSGNYTWHIDEGLPSSTLKNITLTIISDDITLSNTVSCLRDEDVPFFCSAKDAFQITPLMELWDEKSLISSTFNPESVDDDGARYKFSVKCNKPKRLCCKTGGFPAYLPPNFHEMHETCTKFLPRDAAVNYMAVWLGVVAGVSVAVNLCLLVLGVIYYLKKKKCIKENSPTDNSSPEAAQQKSTEQVEALNAQNDDSKPLLQQHRTENQTATASSPGRQSITKLENMLPFRERYQPLTDDQQPAKGGDAGKPTRKRFFSLPAKLPTTFDRNCGRLNSGGGAFLDDTLIEIPEDGTMPIPGANDVFQPMAQSNRKLNEIEE